ncbi:MAG: 50S ribosomal protein L11 methyltransferase [Opitutales bacterium]|nr:50S ribosomal protein L11 methyltransferase [Opitutales bacterium]
MFQLLVEIPPSIPAGFEERFMEMEIPSWTIREDRIGNRLDLIGYFDFEKEGLESYKAIRESFPELPETPVLSKVQDRDWKDAYRDHFQPWCIGDLHWVPSWLRDSYPLPEGANAVYLDPGMAFGTGNHETTRLCAVRLVEAAREWGESVPERSVIDAGCGSGILAISAAKMSFGKIYGFDIDMAAVDIAKENAVENLMQDRIEFAAAGMEAGLKDRRADIVMANILANVLSQNAERLLDCVLPGGKLVLSGILAKELADVKAVYEPNAEEMWGACEIKSRIDGEWADLLLGRPSKPVA